MKPFPAILRSLRGLLFKNNAVPVCAISPRRAAFTLTELLVVITIIAILLGLLYGAIRTVSRFSRETITRGELANIEAAWKQYYNYYHSWPTNVVETGSYYFNVDTYGDVQYEIGPVLARMLAGTAIINSTPPLNSDGVAFLDLTRFEVGTGAPVNAWGTSGKHYFIKLDINGDNQLTVPIDATVNGNTTNLFRRVAVWTANPDKPGVLIGSWMQ